MEVEMEKTGHESLPQGQVVAFGSVKSTLPGRGPRGWKTALIAVATIILGVAAFLLWQQSVRTAATAGSGKGATRPVLTVELTPVKSASFERKLLVSGTVAAWDPVQVGSEINGLKVESIAVDDGAHVKEGQVMAALNGAILRAQLAQQQARLASARASLVKAIQPNRPEDITSLRAAYAQSQANVAQEEASLARTRASAAEAEANAGRYEGLVREGAVSALEGLNRSTLAKTTAADVHNAEQKVQAAKFTAQQAYERMIMGIAGGRREDVMISQSSLAETEATVKQLASQVEQTIIRAPCDGLVVKRSVHIGDIASTGKVMFDLVRDGRLELRAQVPEADLSRIRPGQKVEVQAVLANGAITSGVVREISPTIDLDSRLGTVRIDLPAAVPAAAVGSSSSSSSSVLPFRAGNFARGEIFLGKQDVMAVPSSCVVYKDNRAVVFTVSTDGIAQMRFVDAGERDLNSIEIRQGLRIGESVVARGAGFLKDGDRVQVVKERR
ncbi:MAG: efflux RND transporter periplasmic adaptor subunit [Cyanobacteria bacterium REEB67]|nr:efflux RND transporter periplasmic adaptor subunit [Cyanobacteria bacterium REEB67]